MGGGAQCIIHSFELMCKRNRWKVGGDSSWDLFWHSAGVIARGSLDGGIQSATFLSWVKRATRWVLFGCVCMEIVFYLSHAGNKYFYPDKFCRPTPPRDLMVVLSIIPLTSFALVAEWNVCLMGHPPPSLSPVYEDFFFYPTHHGLMKIVTGEWKLFGRRSGKKKVLKMGGKSPPPLFVKMVASLELKCNNCDTPLATRHLNMPFATTFHKLSFRF